MAISERLELRLADGRLLRLAGIEAPEATPTDPDLAAKSQLWLEAWLKGIEIWVQTLDPRPDRWGRLSALVFETALSAQPVQQILLQEGLARAVPDQSHVPCEAALLTAAKQAKGAARGLWNDPYYAVIAASDRAAFAEHSGGFVEAQGRLSEVKPGAARLMLVFGPPRRGNLVVTVLQRNVKNFENAGLHFHELIGQTLQVRGLLESRFGPEIEVARPNDIEVVTRESDRMIEPVTGDQP